MTVFPYIQKCVAVDTYREESAILAVRFIHHTRNVGRNLLQMTVLAPRIFTTLLHFWKNPVRLFYGQNHIKFKVTPVYSLLLDMDKIYLPAVIKLLKRVNRFYIYIYITFCFTLFIIPCVRKVAVHLCYGTYIWLSVPQLPLQCAVVSLYSVV
jgi:hypothetical protein